MSMLSIGIPRHRARPIECEVGDWIAGGRIPEWNKKSPVQQFSPPEAEGAAGPWLFVRTLGRADGMLQTLWKRVE